MALFDPVKVRSEDTSFRVERIHVGEKHEVTPMEKLLRRISREFSRRKLIGDIAINDDEFDLLIEHMRNVYLVMYKNKHFVHMDAAFCTALVQIGIRYYQRGNYWSHFEKLMNFDFYNMNHRKWINDAFVNTMKRYDRILLSETELVSSILMHSFVSNNYTDDFFDFLFAYYRIDLDRDISRLDRDSLDILVENIKRNDNTARTYQIMEQTANAVRTNTRGSKTRIRRYIRLIDKAFWGEQLPEKSGNRLTRAFLVWQEQSRDFDVERKKNSGIGRRGAKHYSSPYLIFNQKSFSFDLKIPAQMIRFEEAEGLYWSVITNNQESIIEENPCAAVTGYKTDEHVLPVRAENILDAFQFELCNANGRLRLFKIPAAPIRFFDNEGYMFTDNAVDEGEVVSFSKQDFIPVSDAIEDYVALSSLRMTYYSFVTGDIVSLPDGKPISVGKRIQEGILPRGYVKGIKAGTDKVPVYSSVPSVLIKAQARRTAGMAISINGKVYKADDYREKIQSFELMDRSGEMGYIIHLADWGCCEDGLYSVTIDIPNDQSFRQWQFMLINGMDYRFEDAPYLFRPVGTLCTPKNLLFSKSEDIEESDQDDDNSHWSFTINPEKDDVRLLYKGSEVFFQVPALNYRFQGEEWAHGRHNGVWHSDFQPILQIRYPESKITFSLDDSWDDDEDTEHVKSFTKSAEKSLFECDLNTFKSWFGRDVAQRKLFISVPDFGQPVCFLEVFTKSIVVSGVLTENYDEGTIDGTFDIVGKADYYLDLIYKNEKIADKAPIVNGQAKVKTKLRSGTYTAVIYESEEDEFGFDDAVYYEIGTRKLELINPRDLSGKSIRILSLRTADETQSELRLKRIYELFNLTTMDDLEGHLYSGIMRVRNDMGEGKGVFRAYLEIPNLNELTKGYITFDDDGDSVEFFFDEERRILAREPQEGLTKAASYRRYNKSLYPGDYVYEYEFVSTPSPNQIPHCDKVKDYNKPAMSYSVQFRFKGDKYRQPIQTQNVPVKKSANQMPVVNDESKVPVGWIVYNPNKGNRTIEAAGFSVKTYNCLHRAKILDLYQISRMSCSELLKVRNLGKQGIREIIRVMQTHDMPGPTVDIDLGV